MIACSYSNEPELIQVLLDHGSSNSVLDRFGRTALHLACQGGHRRAVEMLLDSSTNVDLPIKGELGNTPLHTARLFGHFEVDKLLLERGADHPSSNKRNLRPLSSACERGSSEIVKLLLEHNADHSYDVAGYSLLYHACWRNKLEEHECSSTMVLMC